MTGLKFLQGKILLIGRILKINFVKITIRRKTIRGK